MPRAIFLRAANVGGNNVFSPKEFAAQHPALKLTNFGHAGTFVSHADDVDLTQAMVEALPVNVPMAIVDQEDMGKLVAAPPNPPAGAKVEVTVFLSDGQPLTATQWPAEGAWEIQLASSTDWCATTLRRPGGRLFPYKVLEDATGRPGTTRSWGVIEKVAKAMA